MNLKESYIKTYVREANLRLYYIIFSWLLCLCTCYLKSSQIIYLIIKPTFQKQKVDNKLKKTATFGGHRLAQSLPYHKNGTGYLLEMDLKNENPKRDYIGHKIQVSKDSDNCLDLLHNGTAFQHSAPEINKPNHLSMPDLSSLNGDYLRYDFIYTNVSEAFLATLEAVITFSIAFTLPIFVYHLWCFLMPSRYHRERINFNKGMCKSLVYILFFLWLITQLLLPQICQFLHLFAVDRGKLQITNQARIAPYLTWVSSTVIRLLLASGTPVCIYLCLKYGIFKLNFLIKNRRITTYILISLAAILSPPDFWSQLSLSFCLFIFFESVIWLYLHNIRKGRSLLIAKQA